MTKVFSRIIELRKEGYTWKGIALRILEYLGIRIPNKGTTDNIKELLWISCVRIKNNVIYKMRRESNQILVVETGVLGDCMLVISALKSIEVFCEQNGYVFSLVCNQGMRRIFKEYAGLDKINYVCFSNRDSITLSDFIKINKQLNSCKYKYIILRDSNSFGFRLVGSLSAKEKIYYSYDVNSRNEIEKKMVNKYFTEVKNLDELQFIPDIWKAILFRIGIDNYKTCLAHISVPEIVYEQSKKFIPSEKYVVLCPEASNRNRSIDIDKCEEIISYLINNYPEYDIEVSTDCRDPNYSDQIQALIQKYNMVDFMGKTTLDQFIVLVSHASMLVGCDSGGIHLAASLGIPSICLKGYWDKPHFLPYVFEKQCEKDKIPIVLYPSPVPRCAFCGDEGRYASDQLCKSRIEAGLSLRCNYEINNQDIFESIGNILGCIV